MLPSWNYDRCLQHAVTQAIYPSYMVMVLDQSRLNSPCKQHDAPAVFTLASINKHLDS
jgi:hypothetical protein